MTKRRRRVLMLVLFPPYVGVATGVMAPLFYNPPVRMLLVGWGVGLVVGAIWLAIAEA